MRRLGLILILTSLLAGCAQIGPGTINRDRFDYANAIADSWKEQTLLNLVRLRYSEIPMFLDVTSVINQYSLEGDVSAGYTWIPGASLDAGSVGAGGKWSDRPTITYVPLTGERLTQRLMKPIDPAAVLVMAQSGWPIEFLFPLTVRSANGLQNTSGTEVFSIKGNLEFFQLVETLRDVQRSGDIGFRIEERGEGQTSVLFFTRPKKTSPESKKRLERLQELLGLDRESTEYRLVYGSIPKDDSEIALLTRSVLTIMVELASWIEVPEAHVEEKRTRPTRTEEQIGEFRTKSLINVGHGPVAPSNTFVSVNYRGTDYWIDDRDIDSKRTFAFLQFAFSLVETGAKQLSPVVTVGAGG